MGGYFMKLIDDVCTVIRKKHYSIRTEQAYVEWIKRFIFFHDGRHPGENSVLEKQFRLGRCVTQLSHGLYVLIIA